MLWFHELITIFYAIYLEGNSVKVYEKHIRDLGGWLRVFSGFGNDYHSQHVMMPFTQGWGGIKASTDNGDLVGDRDTMQPCRDVSKPRSENSAQWSQL